MQKFLIFFLLMISSLAFADFSSLAEQKVIRVYISNAPGMGHQSASAVVMRRMRQLGFQGIFEVVYNDAVAGKLNTLIPGFNPEEKNWQEIPELKIKAISETEFFKSDNISKVQLAVTGADDNRKNMNPKKMRAENYLLLEPQGWGDSFLLQEDVSKAKVIPGLGQIGYFYEVDDSAQNIEREILAIENNPEFSLKSAGLRALFRRHSVMGAIYGVGLIQNMPEKIRIWVQGIQKAEAGFRQGQPVILPIISPLNGSEMQALRSELNRLETPQRKIHLMDIKDPSITQVINSLKAGDTLLVQTGRLPQSLFEALFKRSRLPVLVAGKNAMNLAQNLGKPYINTVHDMGVRTQTNETRIEKMFREASEVFYFSKGHEGFLNRLGLFIQASLAANSEVNAYFDGLGTQGRDKVAEALQFLKAQPAVIRSCEGLLL